MLLGDAGHVAPAQASRSGGRWADAGVGLLGGVMAPLSGFSGLAPALWCTLRGYTKDEHRAVLQNFNLVVLAATMASLVWSGRARAEHLPQMARRGRLAGGALDLGVEDLHRHEPDGVQERRAVAAGVRRVRDAGRGAPEHDGLIAAPVRQWPGVRAARAAQWPEITALSIVAGRPVSIQSPARSNPFTGVSHDGRRGCPGASENVA